MHGKPTPLANGKNGRWERIGTVGVDSALIGISDPAFVGSELKPKNLGDGLVQEWGSGFKLLAGFGDGGYDVWAWIADYGEDGEIDERIAQIVVTLIDAEDLELWHQPWPIGNR